MYDGRKKCKRNTKTIVVKGSFSTLNLPHYLFTMSDSKWTNELLIVYVTCSSNLQAFYVAYTFMTLVNFVSNNDGSGNTENENVANYRAFATSVQVNYLTLVCDQLKPIWSNSEKKV